MLFMPATKGGRRECDAGPRRCCSRSSPSRLTQAAIDEGQCTAVLLQARVSGDSGGLDVNGK